MDNSFDWPEQKVQIIVTEGDKTAEVSLTRIQNYLEPPPHISELIADAAADIIRNIRMAEAEEDGVPYE